MIAQIMPMPMPMPMPIHTSGESSKITPEMIVGFFIIATIINIITLILTRITYENKDSDTSPWRRYKFPIWFYLLLIISWLIPIGNAIIALVILGCYIITGCGEFKEFTIGKHNILNKKI